MAGEWQSTACILCECNCGIVVQLDGRNARQDPRRQGPSRVAGLHLQQGVAAGSLPEQRQPADLPHAPASRRQLRGNRLGHRDLRDRRGIQTHPDTYGGDKIFYYGGGGQGNHLGGAYSGAFLKVLGSHYRSNALAQEKTGEAWVDAHLYGGHTRGEFEHAEVSVFIGKNPWMSQSFPRARTVLNEIAKDPGRSMIVIDPVIDRHRQDGRLPSAGAARHRCLVPCGDGRRAGAGRPLRRSVSRRARQRCRRRCGTCCAQVPVADYAERCGVDEELIRTAARRIAGAESVAVFEDLGIQQAPNSTLCSYLNKLLWILTGNFAKRGGQHLHSSFAPLFRHIRRSRPHSGHRCAGDLGGLVPS